MESLLADDRPVKDADCNTNSDAIDTSGTRSLTLTVRLHPEGIGRMELKGIRTFQPNTRHRRDAWVPGSHEHEERPSGAEAAPRERRKRLTVSSE